MFMFNKSILLLGKQKSKTKKEKWSHRDEKIA